MIEENVSPAENFGFCMGRAVPMQEIISRMKGEVDIVVRGADGELKDSRHFNNLIVQVGHNFVASALVGSSTSPFNAIAVGTNSTAAASGDTTLGTELVRHATTTNSAAANVATFAYTFPAGVATGALTEAGLFNNTVSGGTLFSHVVFSVVNVGALDTITLTWTITC